MSQEPTGESGIVHSQEEGLDSAKEAIRKVDILLRRVGVSEEEIKAMSERLPRAAEVIRKAEVDADAVIDWVVLDHAERHRRRITLKGECGTEFLLDLERAVALDDGDALKLEDGRLVAVRAAAQRLYEVRTDNPHDLVRVAWHVGNRHTPAEITAHALYIEEDHVLGDMLRGLGCKVTQVVRPFHPERGAYDAESSMKSHGHSHGTHHFHAH